MIDKLVETATQRSNIYGFLSFIYRTEVTEPVLKQIKESEFFSVLSDGVDDDFPDNSEDKMIEGLAVEYARLFLGPGGHISPHESVHHERDDGDWGRLWGKSTVEVRKLIESAGLEYKSEFTGLPDHISVELEFMQKLTEEEALAREEEDSDRVNYCLAIESKCINEHLSKWIPAFCDKVIAGADLHFYREMARITKSFIEFEQETFEKGTLDSFTDKS